jgi:hypothetical protein
MPRFALDVDGGVFLEPDGPNGRLPGQVMRGQNAPDALVVEEEPTGPGWWSASDLAHTLWDPEKTGRAPGTYLTRLYSLAKRGFMDMSVVVYPTYKRFYRVPDMEKLRAVVAIKTLKRKYA